MEEVLRYLEMKNHFYEKFYTITLRFIEQTARDEWEDMTLFLDNRERILNIIHTFDYKIAQHFQGLSLTSEDLEIYRNRVKSLMDTREELGKRIITLDLELISKMEDIKTETIRDLKRSVETSQQIGSFAPLPKRAPKPRTDV